MLMLASASASDTRANMPGRLSRKTASCLVICISDFTPSFETRKRDSRVSSQYLPRGADQGTGFFRRANRDPQVIAHFGILEPTHEDFPLPQLVQPLLRRESWRARQDKICLAGKDFKPKPDEFAAKLLPRRDNPAKIRAVMRQIVQRRQSGGLAQAIDIVAVADLIQCGD